MLYIALDVMVGDTCDTCIPSLIVINTTINQLETYIFRGGSRIGLRGGLSISRASARAKFYVLRPLLTSFPHTTSYTKKK